MDSLQQVLVWVLFAVLGAGGLYFVKWMMGHASKAGAERLARFGLLPVPGMPLGSGLYAGQYRDHTCGYSMGQAAVAHVDVETRAGSITSGSELWVELGFNGPPLAVVERGETSWKRLQGEVVPRAEVSTGDPVFDGRFLVRCADPAWARSVLVPAVQAHLLQIPLVFLVQAKKKVIFPLYFDPWRLCRAFHASISDPWSLMDHADVFLDAAILLAEQMRALRPTAPE